jgi:cold shock CspA family protein
MPEKADAARFVAKLLAKRPTPLDEVPDVIANVHEALSQLRSAHKNSPAAIAPPPLQPAPQKVARRPRKAPPPAIVPEVQSGSGPEPEPEQKPAQPTLLRRAEVISVAPVTPATTFVATPPSGSVRGVVQWFDSRTGQGTLRLPGQSHDVPVDTAILGAFGIQRLFKGQEIDATLEGGGNPPKITALQLVNAPVSSPVSGGTVRDRHAKPVVVELKREALSRSAARAEAEQLLRPRRAR